MIRKFLTGIVLLVICGPARSQGKISVSIRNFENNRGSCIVCVYDNAQSFSDKGGKPVTCQTVSVSNQNAAAVFENIKQGTYAIMVIHDANNNRKFDTNFMGIPKEGYGASQNKLPFAAAPRFEENKFAVTDHAITYCTIKLRYIL